MHKEIFEFLKKEETARVRLGEIVRRYKGVLKKEFIKSTKALILGDKLLVGGLEYVIKEVKDDGTIIVNPTPTNDSLEVDDVVEIKGNMFKVTKRLSRGRMHVKRLHAGEYLRK